MCVLLYAVGMCMGLSACGRASQATEPLKATACTGKVHARDGTSISGISGPAQLLLVESHAVLMADGEMGGC